MLRMAARRSCIHSGLACQVATHPDSLRCAAITKEAILKLMREAVIVASSRTGLAKSFRGSFNMSRPDDLAAHCIKDVLKKTPQLDPAEVEDVILGCAQPHGPQGSNVARVAAIAAG